MKNTRILRKHPPLKRQEIREGIAQAPRRAVPAARVGQTQGPARDHHLRGPRCRRQGRHHQGHHRARQPAGVPRGGAARPVRPRKVADVHAALHAAFPGRGRGRDLRPELVQPPRRGICDGLLHEGTARRVFSNSARRWRSISWQGGIQLIKIWLEVERQGAEAAVRGAHGRPACASGNSARWTCLRAASGSSIRAPAT